MRFVLLSRCVWRRPSSLSRCCSLTGNVGSACARIHSQLNGWHTWAHASYTSENEFAPFFCPFPVCLLSPEFSSSYQVDIDLKKAVDESAIKASPTDVKKAVRKIFEERYLNQKDVKSEKKATGVKYFFEKLRF